MFPTSARLPHQHSHSKKAESVFWRRSFASAWIDTNSAKPCVSAATTTAVLPVHRHGAPQQSECVTVSPLVGMPAPTFTRTDANTHVSRRFFAARSLARKHTREQYAVVHARSYFLFCRAWPSAVRLSRSLLSFQTVGKIGNNITPTAADQPESGVRGCNPVLRWKLRSSCPFLRSCSRYSPHVERPGCL
jgi:hypothetical protein